MVRFRYQSVFSLMFKTINRQNMRPYRCKMIYLLSSLDLYVQRYNIRPVRLLLVMLLILPFAAIGQSGESQDSPNLEQLAPKLTGHLYTMDARLVGSPFLLEQSTKGVVIRWDSIKVAYDQLNYNAHRDELVKTNSLNQKMLVHKNQLSGFVLHDKGKARTFDLVNTGQEEKQFLEVLYEGPCILYAARQLGVNYSRVSSNQFNKSVFYENDQYYLYIEGELIAIQPNKRDFYDYFGKARVNTLLNNKQLEIKDSETDLIQFLQLLNESES